MKFIKSKLFMGIVCFIVAILFVAVGIPTVNNITNKKISVVRFKENVEKGSVITEQNIEIVQASPHGLPENVVSDQTEVVNKYAVADAQIGDFVTPNRLSSVHPYANNYLFAIPRGKLAVSFSINSFAAGLSGKVIEGDIISLLTVVADAQNVVEAQEVAAESSAALSYLKVLSATSVDGEDTDSEKKDADGKIILPVTITVIANTEQARLIAGLEQNGAIQIALVSRGDEAYANELLALQDDYFVQMAAQSLLEQEKPTETPFTAETSIETTLPLEGAKDNAE